MIGKTVSHYRVIERIGRGGMGVVYRAEDTKLGRPVALKFLSSGSTGDPEATERFIQEARAASALDHPGICTIHEIDETPEGDLFICMALYAGQSLRKRMKRGPIEPSEAARIALETAEALAAAHAGGVVHRDIKPENLFLTRDGRVKILDFGLAKLRASPALTHPGTALGTAAYMSPEQARGDAVDERTDLWALGVVLYEMLAGRRPFRSAYEPGIVYAILNTEPEPLGARPPAPPEALAALVMESLRKDPAARPPSAGRLADRLRSFAPGRSTAAPPPPARRRAIRLAPLAALAAVLLAAAWLLSGRPFPSGGTAPARRPMLVVLPFENRGPAEDEYFADGITDAITARLAGVGDLGVISRQSAMRYRGERKSPGEIGDELGVDYLLEGSIQRERPSDPTSRLRIIPNLIRIEDEVNLWADTYDEEMTELFRVQSEIAERVARALDRTLVEPERRSVASRPTESLEAYELYLRGNEYFRRRLTEEDAQRAILLFQRAVRVDPAFAVAWAALAQARVWSKWNFGHEGEREEARRAVDEARRLAPDLPETHMALGYFYYYGSREYARALEELRIVRTRRPSAAEAIATIGWIERRRGEWEQAVADLEEALALNPRDPTLTHSLGLTYARMRRYDEAEVRLDRAIALVPSVVYPYVDKALVSIARDGNARRARAVLTRAIGKIRPSEFLGALPLALLRILPETFAPLGERLTLAAPGVDTMSDTVFCFLYRSELARRRGEEEKWSDAARVLLEERVARRPDAAYLHGLLGLAAAAAGDDAAAVREGERAVDLLPLAKDALSGPYQMERLAQICLLAGDEERAIGLIERLLAVPSRLTVPLVRLDPLWDPLRGDDRLEAVLRAARPAAGGA